MKGLFEAEWAEKGKPIRDEGAGRPECPEHEEAGEKGHPTRALGREAPNRDLTGREPLG